MNTLFEHTRNRTLIIPQALFGMRDVSVALHHQNAAIFYKQLEQDLVDIEFYTNAPCFIYIESGYEELTNANNACISLAAGDGILLPQGSNLHSDFVRKTATLKAWLVFFDDAVITRYLAQISAESTRTTDMSYLTLSQQNDCFSRFFSSLQSSLQAPGYLAAKQLELLYLIGWQAGDSAVHALLSRPHQSPRRNIARLLASDDLIHLSVSDLAQLSGRSLSSFNRDFKTIYQQTPSRWLRERRLARAHHLIENEAYSVTDAALAVGYDNVSNFIRLFQQTYGVTPRKIKSP